MPVVWIELIFYDLYISSVPYTILVLGGHFPVRLFLNDIFGLWQFFFPYLVVFSPDRFGVWIFTQHTCFLNPSNQRRLPSSEVNKIHDKVKNMVLLRCNSLPRTYILVIFSKGEISLSYFYSTIYFKRIKKKSKLRTSVIAIKVFFYQTQRYTFHNRIAVNEFVNFKPSTSSKISNQQFSSKKL